MLNATLRSSCLIAAAIGVVHAAAAADPPAMPSPVTARGTSPGVVTVTWVASSGAAEYRVYADVDPVVTVNPLPPIFRLSANAHLVATVTGTSAVDSGLPPLVRRHYAVVAANDAGDSMPAP